MFYRPTTPWAWCFLAVSIIEMGAVLVNEGTAYFMLKNATGERFLGDVPLVSALPTSVVLFILAFVYQSLLIYDTLAQKNAMQLFGLCFYAACLSVYAGLQYYQVGKVLEALAYKELLELLEPGAAIHDTMMSLLKANIFITAFYLLVICCISVKLYGEFQWTIYRQLNADIAMQKRYFFFKIYITLLKYDLFFFIGLMSQYIMFGYIGNAVDFALNIASIPFICALLAASASLMRHENKTGMLVILALHIALLAFFIYKFARMYQPYYRRSFLPIRKLLSYFGGITLSLEFVTIGVAIKCMSNFDKGLKIHVTGHSLAQKMLEEHETDEMELLMLRESTQSSR